VHTHERIRFWVYDQQSQLSYNDDPIRSPKQVHSQCVAKWIGTETVITPF
jgi:hypothetical protein